MPNEDRQQDMKSANRKSGLAALLAATTVSSGILAVTDYLPSLPDPFSGGLEGGLGVASVFAAYYSVKNGLDAVRLYTHSSNPLNYK